MPKVKITTDKTWVGGSRAIKGQTYEVTSEEATVLMQTALQKLRKLNAHGIKKVS